MNRNDHALFTQDNIEDDIVYGETDETSPDEQRRIEERIFDMYNSDDEDYDADPALIAFYHKFDNPMPRRRAGAT